MDVINARDAFVIDHLFATFGDFAIEIRSYVQEFLRSETRLGGNSVSQAGRQRGASIDSTKAICDAIANSDAFPKLADIICAYEENR